MKSKELCAHCGQPLPKLRWGNELDKLIYCSLACTFHPSVEKQEEMEL